MGAGFVFSGVADFLRAGIDSRVGTMEPADTHQGRRLKHFVCCAFHLMSIEVLPEWSD